ncbi:MAPEG family protein [Sulfidibacter corallicola]|uniref:MAPEG family protein n=1 Tax=Sulfidibacter corallicola TaxID=2818388 RepID=A0A8A4TJU3_SULCO|nr:MAPEG family protein [Sulfidibacter corallicola]QTD50196.1 MAPEG family protein [Sulfidibacter corallicola]
MEHKEVFWLGMTAAMTAIVWVPYVLNRFVELGIWSSIADPGADLTPKAVWAGRLMNAHKNAIENLVVFASLVLALAVLDVSTPATGMAAMIYFYARLGHIAMQTFGVPVARTLMFLAGFGAQMVLAFALLGAIS